MVHVTAQSRYGAINTYKANTHGFNRVFRAILAVLEDLSNTYQCSPEGALALIRPHLTLGSLEVVDEPMDIWKRPIWVAKDSCSKWWISWFA